MKLFGPMLTIARSSLLGLFVLAVVVRILCWFVLPGQYLSFGDTREYLEVAERLCRTGRYPFEHIALPTFRAPGFPAFLALSSACFHLPLTAVQLVLVALDSLGALLTAGIVARISRDAVRQRAFLAGTAYALYPLFIQQSATIQSECLTVFAIILSIYFLCRAFSVRLAGRRRGLSQAHLFAVASGACLSVSILTRPSTLAVIPVAFFALKLVRRETRGVLFLAICTAVVGLLPWCLYATGSTGRFVLVNDSFCYSFYRGSKLELVDVYGARDQESFARAASISEAAVRHAEKNIGRGQWCTRAIEEIVANPRPQIKLVMLKLWAYLRPWPHAGAHQWWVVFPVGLAVIGLYLAFVLTLFQRSGSDSNARSIKIVAVVYITIMTVAHMPHQVSNRYRVPYVDPIMLIVAASLLALPRRIRRNRP